uniref:Small ubiquitin-related modifier-like isoform X2 n=1 Tax=Elaeis guineensis var. tenera TaxID=51953 RepID=A0A6J0PLW6_ELAGV|nr:small ubiquitin-related modifier-like isoform X2 [Elaeis guineensis]
MGLLITEETSGYLEHPQESKEKVAHCLVWSLLLIIREKKKMSVVTAKEDRRCSDRSSRINIKIVSNDGYDSVTVRVKRSIKMKDLMKAYNDRRSVGDNTFEFLLDGHRIQAGDERWG